MARETFPYSYTSPYIHLWIFETLWVIIFCVWVLTHPTPTPPLHDPPHPFMTHPTPTPPLHDPPHPTPPLYDPPTPPHPWYIFGHKGAFFHGLLHYVSLLWVIIFWVRVTHKMLNVNCIKIHSIILSVTCHGLRNFPLLIHIPSKPIREFLIAYELLFSELESLIKC